MMEREQMDALQEFFVAGGTGFVNMATPMIDVGSNLQDAWLALHFMPRVGFILPALGGSESANGVSLDMGIEGRSSIIRAGQDFRIHVGGRWGRVIATNDWKVAVGLPVRSHGFFGESFAFGTYVVGLQVGDRFLVSWTGPFDQPDAFGDRIRGQVSVMFVKGKEPQLTDADRNKAR